MKAFRLITATLACLLGVSTMLAQTETSAFYVYQRDGRVNGFFFDEVEKITYSYLDTLGVEFDDYVSQEIITADSTYRFMLADIDSVGFVQPEVILNPSLRNYETDKLFKAMSYKTPDCTVFSFNPNRYNWRNSAKDPEVGDVFAYFDIEKGWSCKVERLEWDDEGMLKVYCKPIDDITDIYQQLILVEEYGYDKKGQMVRRRVAGRPELTIGSAPRRAEGTFEGDVFNFNISGHMPLVNNSNLTVSTDYTLKGKVNVRADWNFPLFGSKYVGVTTRLDLGVQAGFTIDGKIAEDIDGGFGKFMKLPLPATTPLLVLDIGPDVFVRAQAHVKFSCTSPEVGGSIWSKIEFKDWVPSFDYGSGNPDKSNELPAETAGNNSSKTLEINGWVQAGLNFPLKLATLPIMKKLVNASVGGQWFIGPKLTGSATLDLTTAPWDDVAFYNQMKNLKLSFSMCDADFEVTADVESVFSSKKTWTLADGTFNLVAPIDVTFVPDFGECEEYDDMREFKDAQGNKETRLCRVFAFEPSGFVVKPIQIGVFKSDLDPDGHPVSFDSQFRRLPYYQFELLDSHERQKWAEFVLPVPPDGSVFGGHCQLRPFVTMFDKQYVANPTYETDYGAVARPVTDTLFVEYNGELKKPIAVKGTCDTLVVDRAAQEIPDWVAISRSADGVQISVADRNDFIDRRGFSYNTKDTILYDTRYRGVRHEYGRTFYSHFEQNGQPLVIAILPNTNEDPVLTSISLTQPASRQVDANGIWITMKDFPFTLYSTFERTGNQGWHCTATNALDEQDDFKMEYDILSVKPDKPGVSTTNLNNNDYVVKGTLSYSWTEEHSRNGQPHTFRNKVQAQFAQQINLNAVKDGLFELHPAHSFVLTVQEDGYPEVSGEFKSLPFEFKLFFAEHFRRDTDQ